MFIFAPKVADTIAKIVKIKGDDPVFVIVIASGLIGAILWDLLTWRLGLPTSSSHALIGGLSGAAVARVEKSVLRELVITDSIAAYDSAGDSNKVRLLTIAPLLAEAIKRIADESSVSSLFD